MNNEHVTVTQADTRAVLDHLGYDDYDDFCAWAIDINEMNRFDDLVQAFAKHRIEATANVEPDTQALLQEARSALERCAQIVDQNLYRQHEKVEDVPRIARATLTKLDAALGGA